MNALAELPGLPVGGAHGSGCLVMREYPFVFAEIHDCVVIKSHYKYSIVLVTLTPTVGLKAEGEPSIESAQRELVEETGYVATEWRHPGSFIPNSNYDSGKAQHSRELNAPRVSDIRSGDLEEMEILFLSKVELPEALRSGTIHAMSMAATASMSTNPLLQ